MKITFKFKEYSSYIGKLCLDDNGAKNPAAPSYYGNYYRLFTYRQSRFYCSLPNGVDNTAIKFTKTGRISLNY